MTTPITNINSSTFIIGELLASNRFSRNLSVELLQKGWQLSCHLFWCKLTLFFYFARTQEVVRVNRSKHAFHVLAVEVSLYMCDFER